ncbi:HAD family hydrolase [Actimicrobium antarcticum]|uniref:HAD family hydrolase n=1 Tax=Actimicrobium antarcticum TaxID=1051899 RepID=A0ABP7TFY4_9BURK
MNQLPIKALLFDLDDTLWPIVPVIVRAETILHDWLRRHAPAVAQDHSIETMRARRLEILAAEPRYKVDLVGLRHAGLTEAFHASGADPVHVDGAMAIFNTARNAVTPYDDVLPSLLRLGGRVALGTISNGSADLDTIGLAGHFRISIAAHQFGTAKPDAAIFHAACSALEVDPAETVYVGDDPLLDVVGAQQAGLRAVWMNRFSRTLPDHVRPDASCVSLLELEHWLEHRIILAPAPIAR